MPPVTGWHGNGYLWAGPVVAYFGNWYAGGMKVAWYRVTSGVLAITGRRTDASAAPLKTSIPCCYGLSGFQPVGMDFPSEGCWEVSGKVVDQETGVVQGQELQFVVQVLPARLNPGGSR